MNLLRLPAAGALMLAAWPSAAQAAESAIVAGGQVSSPVRMELLDSSMLGCGQGVALWSISSGGTQCAFDVATRGARISALYEPGSSSIEAYATIARATAGAFTPDLLLTPHEYRGNEATDFFLVGFKGGAFENRVKVTAEFARTQRVVDELRNSDWALADWHRSEGTSASVRFDAAILDQPGLKWSLSGEYRSTTDDYSVGRSSELFRYFALPGSRLALSSKARIGEFGLTAGMDQLSMDWGRSSSRKAGVDWNGLSLRLVARESSASPLEASTLLESRTQLTGAYFDLDSAALADKLVPSLGELPFLVPTDISVNFRSGETENRFETSVQRYRRSSFGIDGNWQTPLGETSLSYWRDTRLGLTDDANSRATETIQLFHSVRRGNWRFGLDASLTRTRGEGSSGFNDRSVSFGQSIAYSARNGPEFRLQLGQDRARMHMTDESYASADFYSSVTASLDLTRYLQKRFDRNDLLLRFDYRRAVDRSDSEMSLEDGLIDRWVDNDRREGFLMSFGMRL